MFFAICDSSGAVLVRLSFEDAARLSASTAHPKRKRRRAKTEDAILQAFKVLKQEMARL